VTVRWTRRSAARLAVLGLAIVAACVPPAGKVATDSHERQTPAFFVGPADFAGGRAVFDVEPAKGGVTTLVVVPAFGIADYRAGRAPDDLSVTVTAAPSAVGRAEIRAGHPLPPIRVAPVADVPAPAAVAVLTPPETRTFHVWSTRALRYVEAPAHRSYLGHAYAFYDDDANLERFTSDEYAAMDAVLETWWPGLVARFGPTTDVDGDGHVLVFVSRTAVEGQPGAQATVDRCALYGDGDCGPPGEILVTWSLDGFAVPAAGRSEYVSDFFPRTLLHETVHLSQQAPAVRAHRAWPSVVIPEWVLEGQAQLMRFVSGIGLDELWDDVRSDPAAAPFLRPYAAGALPFWWVEQRAGGDAQRRVIAACLDPAVVDPFDAALGVSEPLVLAETYAALRFDPTSFGRNSGPDASSDDVPRRLGARLPVVALSADTKPVTASVRFTAHVAFQIAHDTPVRITLATDPPDRAYVLVAHSPGG
jgi:hypothetical protein